MENTSKSNLLYQYDVIKQNLCHEINFIDEGTKIDDVNCDYIIKILESIKELQIALKTLTN